MLDSEQTVTIAEVKEAMLKHIDLISFGTAITKHHVELPDEEQLTEVMSADNNFKDIACI